MLIAHLKRISTEMLKELPDPQAPYQRIGRTWSVLRRRLGHVKQGLPRQLSTSATATKLEQQPWNTPILDYRAEVRSQTNKRALMAYVVSGFKMSPADLRESFHSSFIQSIEIAKAFNRIGYAVDIVDVSDTISLPQGRYDVFMGEHLNFERLLPCLQENTVKIFYATRSHWAFEHKAFEARARRVKEVRGINLPYAFWDPPNDWAEKADATISIGNRQVSNTYIGHARRFFAIDNSSLPITRPDLDRKDYVSARKHFLWFASGPLLHKGLDLVLEAFSGLPDLHLWICGPLQSKSEEPFVHAYRRELFHTRNIHPVGMIGPDSSTMHILRDMCASNILTSCAEAMSGSVMTCMGHGLVPIVSQETGVDTENFGTTLAYCDVADIRLAALSFANFPPEVCRRMAQEAYHQTQTRYTLNAFRENIEQLLRTVIRSHKG